MSKILTIKQATTISKTLRKEGKTVVLVGGCFDILHVGHIRFLSEAKSLGDTLFVMLESDETVHRLKGFNRPINSQTDRAMMLAALACVDYVVLLPPLATDAAYDDLVFSLKPAIIGTTKADPYLAHKKRQVQQIQATLVEVIDRLPQSSTNTIDQLLKKEHV